MDSHDAEVLAALEQELLAPAVRRVRRRFCAATGAGGAVTVAGLGLVGPAFLVVLYLFLVTAGLALVAWTQPFG